MMGKSLFINFIESKYRDIIFKILFVFAFVFSCNLFSQIFVQDSSAIFISQDAIITEKNIATAKGKIYIVGKSTIINFEKITNSEIVYIKSKEKHPAVIAKKTIPKKKAKQNQLTKKVTLNTSFTFSNTKDETRLYHNSSKIISCVVSPRDYKSGIAIIKDSFWDNIILFSPKRNTSFYKIYFFNNQLKESLKVRPPPQVISIYI